MRQPPRRSTRPARTPTSRPRRVAGQGREDAGDGQQPDSSSAVTAESGQADATTSQPKPERVDLVKRTEPAVVVPPGREQPDLAARAESEVADEPEGDREPLRRRLVVGLGVAIVLLLAVGVAELIYLRGTDTPDPQPISADRPVQVGDLEVRRVVDQAATAADLILSASSKDYDAQVEEATATMTDSFADDYRTTKADIKERFVAQQTEVVVDISAQGVVTASEDEIVALIFLTQTTQKGTRGSVTPVQFRVTVTMVDTADGWLVSALQAL